MKMSVIAVLGFYPVWAASLTVALTALRLGRSVGRGLLLLCAGLSLWVTGLVLSMSPATMEWAGRLIPSGMLLAGGFVQAFSEVAQLKARRWVTAMWAFGLLVSLTGLFAPSLIYVPEHNSVGPVFWPLCVVATVATLATHWWMLRHTVRVAGVERKRRAVLLLANVLGSLGGGGIVMLVVLNLGPMALAAPLLLGAVLLATWAVVNEERGRHRELVTQGLWYALGTAVLSAVGLTFFIWVLPDLLPETTQHWAFVAWVVFLAALPLDPIRQLVVDAVGARVFARPTGVVALTGELEQATARAQHAEQLAALGTVASVVAHEIRNPLGVILAQAKLLEREGANVDRVADVRAQIGRASRFVDELLRYSKPRSFTVGVVNARTAAHQAIKNIEAAQQVSCLVLAPGPELSFEADEQAFVDALTIVLSNAAIAVATVPAPQVLIRLVEAASTVQVVVEDNGPGVPPELEPRLFELFATGRGRDDRHPGTGLGLAIAAQHVKRHGGTLRYERISPAGGARFISIWPKTVTSFG